MVEQKLRFKSLLAQFSMVFPEAETSFREIHSAYYVISEYPKSVNQKVNIPEERKLYRLISVGGFNDDFVQYPENAPVTVSITFSIYNVERKAYAMVLPPATRLTRCPRSYDLSDVFFSETTGNFSRNGKPIDIFMFLRSEIRRNERVLSYFRGLPTRLFRRFRWYFLSPTFKFIGTIFRTLFLICTGKRLLVKQSDRSYAFNYLLGDDKAKIEVEEKVLSPDKTKEIDFFGMKVKLIPLITYASINLLAYFVLYMFGFKPPVLKTLFGNALLSALYVIVSYSFLEFGLGSLLQVISMGLFWIEKKTQSPDKRGFVS